MTQINLTLPDMTCGGCAKVVTKAVQKLDPAAVVEADPPSHLARITTIAREADLRAALADAGFPPA
jgi:copper chaperone